MTASLFRRSVVIQNSLRVNVLPFCIRNNNQEFDVTYWF